MSMDAQDIGCYDIRGRDLRQLYAGWGRMPISDEGIWCLSMATATLPENHIGFAAWITDVAGTNRYGPELMNWCRSLAETAATLKPLVNARRRLLVESYEKSWGDRAALDGLTLVFYGKGSVMGLRARAEQFGCRWEAYKKIRNLVAGAVVLQMQQYEDALKWAVRIQRNA